jgi:hypothetical protein
VDRCAQCGFIFDDLPVDQIAGALRALPGRYRLELADVAEAVCRRRPQPEVWSALEYTCHVRDVLLVQRDRALLALVETRPSFPRMYRDERVGLAGYDAHPLEEVAAQLGMAAELCATVFERLSREQHLRPLIYNYPAPMERDVAWLGRHTVHEGEHHLSDVRQVLLATDRLAP